MRTATVQEYNNVTATPHVTKRHFPGKRVSSIEWKLMGKTIARKTETLKRGRVTSTEYEVDPEYITPADDETEVTIRFVEDCKLEVTWSFDEDTDDTETTEDNWQVGDELEVDIVTEHGDTTTWQHGDGSMCYCVPNRLFVKVPKEQT